MEGSPSSKRGKARKTEEKSAEKREKGKSICACFSRRPNLVKKPPRKPNRNLLVVKPPRNHDSELLIHRTPPRTDSDGQR